ncbi:MAG: hypothetical protein R3B84_16395 [Zavarzinella sp.]
MAISDIDKVLRNWIDQAISPLGSLPPGTEPAQWVAEHFVAWWRDRVEDDLCRAEYASQCLRDELSRLNDAERLDEAFHELSHIQDALSDLRASLGMSDLDDSGK